MATLTVPSGLTVTQWDEKLFHEFHNQNFFRQFMGTGSNKMIHVREELTKKPGDTIKFQLANRLTGTAKGAAEALEGAEEDLTLRSFGITVREYSHAVRYSKFEGQKTAIDIRQANKDVLMHWEDNLFRDLIIEAMGSINGVKYSSASEAQKDAWLVDNTDRVLFGASISNHTTDHSTALGNVDTTSDKLTPDAISLMKRIAKTANPKVRPFKAKSKIGDSDAYVLFAPTQMVRDLAANTTFVSANREARNRGLDNPLFTGADYMWENIAIYEIEDIPSLGAVGNGSAVVRPCYLCGAQALGIAWAKRPETVTEEFDYGRSVGIAVKQWMKIEKLRFGSGSTDTDDYKDHGIVTGYFAAAADA